MYNDVPPILLLAARGLVLGRFFKQTEHIFCFLHVDVHHCQGKFPLGKGAWTLVIFLLSKMNSEVRSTTQWLFLVPR